MNKTTAYGRDIVADTQSNLATKGDVAGTDLTTGDRAANPKGNVMPKPGKRHITLAGAIVGITAAVAFLGVMTVSTLSSTGAQSHGGAPLQISPDPGSAAAARPPVAAIVPAHLNDTSPGFFSGTGDGSNGFWTRQ